MREAQDQAAQQQQQEGAAAAGQAAQLQAEKEQLQSQLGDEAERAREAEDALSSAQKSLQQAQAQAEQLAQVAAAQASAWVQPPILGVKAIYKLSCRECAAGVLRSSACCQRCGSCHKTITCAIASCLLLVSIAVYRAANAAPSAGHRSSGCWSSQLGKLSACCCKPTAGWVVQEKAALAEQHLQAQELAAFSSRRIKVMWRSMCSSHRLAAPARGWLIWCGMGSGLAVLYQSGLPSMAGRSISSREA